MKKSIIGVVRIPVAKLLSVSSEWRKLFGFPEPTSDDWRKIISLRGSVSLACIHGNGRSLGRNSFQEEMAYGQTDLVSSTTHCLKLAKALSFYDYLDQRMLGEMKAYAKQGVTHLLADFSFEQEMEEPAVYWICRQLAESFRDYCKGEFTIGIRTEEDNWSVDLACRFGYDFICSVESGCYSDVIFARNRMTDGTGKKKPVVFSYIYSYNYYGDDGDRKGYSDADIARFSPEGCILCVEDEDKMDELGRIFHKFSEKHGLSIPLVTNYNEEIKRGELTYEMKEWGARDGIMVDPRKNKWRYGTLDEDELGAVVGKISKFK